MSFRFWRHVEFHEDNECWPWTGCTTANGYGRARKHLVKPTHPTNPERRERPVEERS